MNEDELEYLIDGMVPPEISDWRFRYAQQIADAIRRGYTLTPREQS